ncbi:cilia- and flagella-associated protein 95-like [Trichomycterus rosablanca]|uniref:cilia- and flagella-associated protein 95-like n=1 Tax=Trichomycterus rosablanca TaxID=2290929 RepID=UPI002F35C240
MNYSRATLNSDWHKKREAEPKDYDFTTCCDGEKKSHRSTYKRLGTCLDADWITTAQMYQYPSKKECDARETPKLMVQADCFNSLVFDRITGPLHFMCTSVLPCQSQGYGQRPRDQT